MERNLHTYHSFPLNLRHIIVVGLFDHKKQFLERKFTFSDYIGEFRHRHPPDKKVSITGAVLTLENLLQLIDSLFYK